MSGPTANGPTSSPGAAARGDLRIGVYVCHCGTNISQTVDVEDVARLAASLPGVVVARDYKYTCSEPGQEMIRNDVRELGLSRVVVAACSPLMHEPTFRRACAQAGLNPFLFQMANIREHCSWVHEDRAAATAKAKRLVAAAVSRVALHEPLAAKEVPVNPAVLVVGGGIAGIEASLQIADGGKQVYLVEQEPSIGGHMARFDKTFPTLDCAACILTPKMVSVGQHPMITLLSYSEVAEVSGYIGNFRAKVRRKARYVDEKLCTGCGLCIEKCPWKAPDEFNEGLTLRKAIHRPFAQAVPNVPVIDRPACRYFKTGKCRVCQRFCPRDAIRFEQEDEYLEVEVGSIILATGFQAFDARRASQYGYGQLANVLSALEFERLSHASGPTGGEVLLKSGEKPRSVAILHCIGSRDVNYHEYCSRVCCMFAMKFAHLVREKTHAKVYEFYIDLRAFGKGYEEFYKRLLHEDVVFVRGKGAEVRPALPKDGVPGSLLVRAEDTLLGEVREIPVDMVILGTGLEPRADAAEVARVFGISRSADGFFLERHPKLAPVNTASDGIFVAGACQGPKDIPDSVAQGAAAAAGALSLISRGRVEIEPIVASIDEASCSGCKVCWKLCPYAAIQFDELDEIAETDEARRVARVEAAICKGCGVCVAACPTGAAQQRGFTDRQLAAEIDAALRV